jgi:hypothetical protein
MVDYNPLDSRFLTTANAITRNGQKFVRIILDIQDNIFYTLDDDGNFNPIGSGGTASSGVTSINTSTGLSGNTTTGAVTIVNTSPDQTVTITGGTDIEITGSYPDFGVNLIGTTIKDNLYGNVNGDTYTLTGLTANTWSVYEGTWTRIINNGISISFNPPAISVNDPLYNGHILMFNVTGEIDATANHAVEIGWSWNDPTPTIIAGSNQVTHLRSGGGAPVGNFNQNFLAEISQGSNDFFLFARNLTDNTNITLTNINVVITTVYSPNA